MRHVGVMDVAEVYSAYEVRVTERIEESPAIRLREIYPGFLRYYIAVKVSTGIVLDWKDSYFVRTADVGVVPAHVCLRPEDVGLDAGSETAAAD